MAYAPVQQSPHLLMVRTMQLKLILIICQSNLILFISENCISDYINNLMAAKCMFDQNVCLTKTFFIIAAGSFLSLKDSVGSSFSK